MKRLILFTFLIFSLAFTLLASARVQAVSFNPFSNVCTGSTNQDATVCQEANKQQCANITNNCPNSIYGRGSIIAKATSLVAIVAGVASVIVIIIGGIKFIMSGGETSGRRAGDASGLNSARNTIIYALVGVAIAVAAQSIVVFVLNKL